MPLEDIESAGKYISDLDKNNPLASDAPGLYGDNHIRGIKNTIKNTFPSIDGAVTTTDTELNILDGVTKTTDDVNNLIRSVPTLAALIAHADLQGGISVLGRTANGDGYEGDFVWMSGDQSAYITADTQQSTWVAPSSDATGASGAWKRIDGIDFIEHYGAADGLDSTSEIQAGLTRGADLEMLGRSYTVGALNIASGQLSGKGELALSGSSAGMEFSENTSNKIFSGITITGDGLTASGHKGYWHSTSFTVSDIWITNHTITACVQGVDIGAIDNATVYGCSISRSAGILSGQGYGVVAGGEAMDAIVALNHFTDNDRHSLYSGNPDGQVCIGNTFRDHGKTAAGAGTTRAAHAISRGHDIVALGETFIDTEGAAITVDDSDSVTGVLENVLISNCLFRNTNGKDIQIGLDTPNANANVQTVSIKGCQLYPRADIANGFVSILSGKYIDISNNTFYAPSGTVGGYYGISISPASAVDADYDRISITGNVGSVTSSISHTFVSIGSVLCLGATPIEITGNNVDTGSSDPITYSTTPTNPNIKHDYLAMERNVVLAAGSQDLNIAGYYSFVINGNSGGSSIANITNGYKGKIIRLRFADAFTTVTRTNSALSGGVNFTGSNRDILILENVGGIWLEKTRSVNS